MATFKKHIKIANGVKSEFVFLPDANLPTSISISTPMNFVYKENKILLSLDKDGMWNVVCGKIDGGETWQDATRRETLEEVGAEVGTLYVVGYVLCKNNPGSKFDPVTFFPVCYSFSNHIIDDWWPLETKDRGIFSYDEARELLGQRNDDEHMLEIFEFVHSKMEQLRLYNTRP